MKLKFNKQIIGGMIVARRTNLKLVVWPLSSHCQEYSTAFILVAWGCLRFTRHRGCVCAGKSLIQLPRVQIKLSQDCTECLQQARDCLVTNQQSFFNWPLAEEREKEIRRSCWKVASKNFWGQKTIFLKSLRSFSFGHVCLMCQLWMCFAMKWLRCRSSTNSKSWSLC